MSKKLTYEELQNQNHVLEETESERKKAETAPWENEEHFRTILEDLSESVFIHNLDGNYLFVNDAACKATGYSRSELMKMKVMDLATDGGAVFIEHNRLWNDLRKNKLNKFETKCIRKDGSEFIGETTLKAIMLNGKPVILVIVNDITQHNLDGGTLARRLKYERLISDISSEFVKLRSHEIDAGINRALASVSSFSGADRAYVLLFRRDEQVVEHMYEWCAENAQSQIEKLKGFSVSEKMPFFNKQIRNYKMLKIPDVEDLLPEARLELEYFTSQGIKSILIMPMRMGDRLLGFVGLDAVLERKIWTDDDQSLLRVVSEIFTNVIERKRVEEEQNKLQKQLSNALEMALLGPWEFDSSNNLFILNDQFYKIFRTTANQVGGYTMLQDEYFQRFVHPDDIPMIKEKIQKGLEASDRFFEGQIEHRIIYSDGETGHIMVRYFIIKYSQGQIIKTHGVNQDITERKKAEEALRESEEFSSSLLEYSPNAVLVFNPDTSIRYVNPLFEKLTGFTSEEVLGKKAPFPWWIDYPKYGAIEQQKKYLIEGTHGLERSFKKKNDDHFWVEINNTPIYLSGELDYFLSTWIDITERKKAEKEKESLHEKLQRSQKMESLGLLAGGVAHDLNNVLAGIVSYPELLLLDLPEDSSLRQPIETIEESGHRAVAIVQDLLTIARGVATTKEVLNLNDLIRDYLKSPESKKLEQYHPAVTIETNLDTTLLNINGSHVHLRKVVMNLVSNASEAIEGSGKVLISTENRYVDRPLKLYDDVKTGEYAVLSVLDDGLGISSVDLERIFEPFYSKKVMGRSGTGLGLAVVWNVIKEHEGYINVTSDEGGTNFDLYFPITREKSVDKDFAIPIEKIKGNGEKILIVDDIDSQREITCNILEKLNYKASSVSSGEAAVEYIKDHRVDLILLDMIMYPGINGRETYERIVRIHPGQKAIIVSGFVETDEVKAAQKLGAGQYIKKPLTLQKLGLAIKEELEKT